jgi:CDP-glucose 4,6-dehydratase
VVASSDKAYGEQDSLPYRESTPLAARHPYDVSKACADLIARSYASAFGLPVAVTRAGHFFGGGDLNWSRVVPGTIRSVLQGTPPVIRSDGTPIRDYLYVEDAVDAYLLLAEAARERRLQAPAVNVSYEQPHAVREIVSAILEHMESPLEPIVEDTAEHEIRDQHLDSTILREQLGWAPRCGFREGLKRTVAWYRDYLADDGGAVAR